MKSKELTKEQTFVCQQCFFFLSLLVTHFFFRGGGMSRYITLLLLRYSHLILA